MAGTDQVLLQYANDIAEGLVHQKATLQNELAELQRQILAKQAERDLASSAAKRLLDFRPTLGRDYQCPDCWISRGQHATLRSVGGGTREADFLVCNVCEAKWEIPI